MPRSRPAASGYARIAQAEEEEDDDPYFDEEEPLNSHRGVSAEDGEYAPIQPKRRERMQIPSGASSPRRKGRRRANSGVDIKAINARLERWAEEIKERFKIRRVKGKSVEDEHLEIYSSVFQAPDWIRPATKETLRDDYDDSTERLSKLEFDDLVESVRTAIELGVHPKLITQGSSGSYFARNSGGKTVGVFKPKDEEPYASRNPKWTKWLHRNLLPFAFGRAMLIPNLSYVSEAAAYVLDCQLRTNIVPYTDVVGLSSHSFHYDFWERRAYWRKRRPLPEKPGSFQVFLKGYKGATEFFREHPWPDKYNRGIDSTPAMTTRRKKGWADSCTPGSTAVEEDEVEDGGSGATTAEHSRTRPEFWNEALQLSFREQLEKLVILDYVMRNTDRGTDNWMIRIDRDKNEAEIVVEPPKQEYRPEDGQPNGDAEGYRRRHESMGPTATSGGPVEIPRLGAIDNSLSWPWKHPDQWRSYPFGWLFLPVSLIGRPFSERTRRHFLPLLTSKEWWTDTQVRLRKCFELDVDFQEKMFARQMAVMKGQAWNVVETLKTPDHGPLELTRRSRVLVWDDVVEVPVAVPMTRPEETRRATAQTVQPRPKTVEEEEEMDISAAHSSEPALSHDILGLSSPSHNRTENPFNHSRQNSSQDVRLDGEVVTSSSPHKELTSSTSHLPPTSTRPGHLRSFTSRPVAKSRVSYEIPRTPDRRSAERRRRFSFAVRRSSGFDEQDEEEDLGDLGYAAVGEQESARRKVTVERLEMVKGKNPFFTWC
ncbi:hypothetical protein BAUCODRAFT_472794 [Baudoinia panamericana UAMH 10762]|uniref:Phosphatidylinositol 4-kinase n=1 Tax=Baudoinia panamericana (strain UAMH 10762) TaxID=717646 RepID=M2NB47_BAUPA|nr:uncharacterized protein BAUCODRAFT_472794 [Baudoinia panamericana UAMH 10762]EMC96374.1 hypothetical protein BAUCODRAFT_472794 [Baudoinia panamericana UAMH 10762]